MTTFNHARWNHRPFGVRLPNNVTFERSVTNPTSVLAKVVRYLRRMSPRKSTRLEIAVAVMGFDPNKGNFKGWNSNLFRGMVAAGFIDKTRNGRQFLYTIGPNADKVVR